MRFLLNWLVNSIAIAVAAVIVPGIAPFGADPWVAYAIAGLFLGIMGVVRYSQVSPGLFMLPALIGGDSMMNLVWGIVGCVIAFAVAFAVSFVLGVDEDQRR